MCGFSVKSTEKTKKIVLGTEGYKMSNEKLQLPKIAMGAWAWGNDGTFGGTLLADALGLQIVRGWEKEMK